MDALSVLENATLSAVIGAAAGAFFGGIISWIIAWCSRRDSQKFSQFIAFESVLDDLEEAAAAYWRKGGQSPVEESAIKSLLERLDLRLQAVTRVIGKHEIIEDSKLRFDALDEEITGGDFEGSTRRRDSVKVFRLKSKAKEIRDWLYSYI